MWYLDPQVKTKGRTLSDTPDRLRISLFDAECCGGPDTTGEYAQFLRSRFGERIEVRLYRVGGELGFSQVPPGLAKGLFAQGANTVPLLAIDGDLVAQGDLPNWIEAIRIVKERLAASPVAAASA